ncbi:hypothetical protein LCGC14_2540800 [marine sediment metagenome]|uniref:Uncharacterized protein n=1 Tax=marine sediment metagenome TaxID=412755 RepID=A0A0F9DIV2_9ZZZZ
MGTCYHGVCLDCKKFVHLDKYWDWAAYDKECDKNLNDYKTDRWVSAAMTLHLFLDSHNGHRVGVYSDHEFEGLGKPGVPAEKLDGLEKPDGFEPEQYEVL